MLKKGRKSAPMFCRASRDKTQPIPTPMRSGEEVGWVGKQKLDYIIYFYFYLSNFCFVFVLADSPPRKYVRAGTSA